MGQINLVSLGVAALTLVLFGGLFVLQRRKVNFGLRVVVALGAGAILGAIFRNNLEYIEPIGAIYVQVLIALVAPLIIISILSSVTALGSLAKLRTIGLSSVFWLLTTNFIAILLTLAVALTFGVGTGANLDLTGGNEDFLTDSVRPLRTVLLSFFPKNVVSDVQSNNIIAIIALALLVAVSYIVVAQREREKVQPFRDLVEAIRVIFYRAVKFVIETTPYAVLVLVAYTASMAIARLSTAVAFISLFVLTMIIALVDTYLVNGFLLRIFADLNPVKFFKKLTPAQYTAFTTQSSIGTLPLTLELLTRKIGVSGQVANFTAPLGTTIGMPGCAGIWPIITAVFSINMLGIEYSVADYVILIVVGLLVSIGTAGVPGTAIITATAVFTAAGLPVQVLVILVPVSAIAGTASTMANVTAAATSAAIVARRHNLLDDEVFNDRAPALEDSVAVKPKTEISLATTPALSTPAVPTGACDI